MLYLLHGADSFSRHEKLLELRRAHDADGMLGNNSDTFDGRRVTLGQLTMVCDAWPFLGDFRWVHVTGLLARAGQERSGSSARRGRGGRATARAAPEDDPGWLALADYADRLPPTTVLVLEDGDLRVTNALLAALTPKATVFAFPRLTDRAIEGWIGERARRRGVLFDKAALMLLAQSVSPEASEDGQWHALWSLAADIEKLSLYTGDGRISEAAVRRLAPAAQETRMYLLTDAVAERRLGEALTLVEELLGTGRPAPVLLATIAGRYRQLILLREMLDARYSPADIQERMGVRTEFQFRRLREQAQRWPSARLEQAYLRIVDADRSIKSGKAGDVAALELLVAELTI